MRILVTGCSGFIGGHLVNLLIAQGNQVVGLDNRPHNIKISPFQFELCDINDKNHLIQIARKYAPDAIIHLAAQTNLNKCDPNAYAVNIGGVENIIEAVRLVKTINRTIFTSTQLVCHVGYMPKSDTDFAPTTLYGRSKVRTEEIVRNNDGGGSKWCLVRPTTVWGPNMGPHYHRFFKMIYGGQYFHVGSKPLFKSYSYVGNIVYQYSQLLKSPDEHIHGKVFYLADYEPVSIRSWADDFQRELGAKHIKSCPENIARVVARLGDIINKCGFKSYPFNSFRLNNVLTEYIFDLSQTKAVCGPLPFTISEGVKETAKWIRGNIINHNSA